MSVESAATCSGCGLPVDPDGPREPCGNCGALGRRYSLNIHDRLGIRDGLRGKQKRPGFRVGKNRKGVAVEFRNEVTTRGDNGERIRVQRTADRINDRYDEIISDPKTGEILREVHEPLGQHKCRGSAKAAHRKK